MRKRTNEEIRIAFKKAVELYKSGMDVTEVAARTGFERSNLNKKLNVLIQTGELERHKKSCNKTKLSAKQIEMLKTLSRIKEMKEKGMLNEEIAAELNLGMGQLKSIIAYYRKRGMIDYEVRTGRRAGTPNKTKRAPQAVRTVKPKKGIVITECEPIKCTQSVNQQCRFGSRDGKDCNFCSATNKCRSVTNKKMKFKGCPTSACIRFQKIEKGAGRYLDRTGISL